MSILFLKIFIFYQVIEKQIVIQVLFESLVESMKILYYKKMKTQIVNCKQQVLIPILKPSFVLKLLIGLLNLIEFFFSSFLISLVHID